MKKVNYENKKVKKKKEKSMYHKKMLYFDAKIVYEKKEAKSC
jgi:hypothetical protein